MYVSHERVVSGGTSLRMFGMTIAFVDVVACRFEE